MNFEYMYLTEVTTALEAMQLRLTALGSLGWEVCGFAAADRTIGLDAYTAILKREVACYVSPDDLDSGWKHDPSGRADQRFWDGLRWTEHTTKGGAQGTDWPNVRAHT